MLRFYLGAAKPAGLITGEKDSSPGPFGKTLEHTRTLLENGASICIFREKLADNKGRSGAKVLNNKQTYVDDPVQVYLAEVDKIPPLTRAEEILCIQRIRAGDQETDSA